MPYKRPGVFIEETLKPLSATVSDVSEAEGAFVGTTVQGPTVPTRVTSWVNYVTQFGGFGDGRNLLPFALYQYFANGGHAAWIVRAVNANAAVATLSIGDRNSLAAPVNGTFSTSTTGGSLAATTQYSYQVTATTASGESLPSSVSSITTGAGNTNTVTVTWAAVPGATGYKIYGRSTSRGQLASVGAGVTNWTDTGSDSPAAAAPTVDSTAPATLTVSAISPGAWGNNLNISTTAVAASGAAGRFNLFVYLGGTADGNIVERFLDVSLDPADGRYVVSLVNSPVTGSSYIRLTDVPGNDTYDATKAPALLTNIALAAGGDGTGTPDVATAAYKLESITTNLVLNIPGVSDGGVINPVISWAANQGNVFLVVDGPQAVAGASADATATAYLTAASGLTPTSYAAVYGPWLRVDDPAGRTPGSMRVLPPGGAVVGQYIRTDVSRGVQKPPAGLDTSLNGVLDVDTRWLGTNLDNLNERGVNVIRPVPGAGICIMGARTLLSGMPDRYVSIRRSLMYIRKGLSESTRFAIFEPNNTVLWEELEAVANQFLTGLLQAGVLKGETPDEAFFVKCDEENNPASQVASGTVVIEVGVALSAPAEFIVIRIGQFEGGTATDELTLAA